MFHTILSRCSAVSSKTALPIRWCSTNIDFKAMISNNKVVVFMKGVPDKPRCGYSNAVIQILKHHGVEFDAHNVLDDWDLRQGIKEFSNWPTIPQVFINGEFVGGADTLLSMHKNGELLDLLEKAGIVSELTKKNQEEKKTS